VREIFALLSPVIVEVLTIVLLALAGVFARWASTWIKAKGIDKLIQNNQVWADIAVRTAEDIFISGEGEQKLAYACGWLSDRLRERGIKISIEEIEGLVRSAYREIIAEWTEEEYETEAY